MTNTLVARLREIAPHLATYVFNDLRVGTVLAEAADALAAYEADASELRALLKEAKGALDAEEAALIKYRDESCQGDDPVKRHAWTVADARLSEVGVIRRLFTKLKEARNGG